jgi:IS30 family transposase
MREYKHLSKEEREKIAALLQDGKKQKEIATELFRDEGTISREIKRNKTMVGIRNNNNAQAKKKRENYYYFPEKAQRKYLERRKESKQQIGLKSLDLREFIIPKIKAGWSPIIISGRVKKKGLGKISHECIYQFIYRKENKDLELWKYLARSHKRRKAKLGRKSKRYLIPNRIDIDNRPKKASQRTEFGHWEADSIVGPRGTHFALHTEIERKTRLVRIKRIPRKTAQNTSQAMIKIWQNLPSKARKSTTADNGSEFCDWETVAKKLSMDVYFAKPYHSWERGSNERANGLIRRFFPKKTNFSKITDQQIQQVENWINNRPMKCLNFNTPYEAFYTHISALLNNCT